jgi:hypothetical protein
MVDLVVVWDHSGSMTGHPLYGEWVRGLKEAVLGNRQDLRVAVVKMTDGIQDGVVSVHTDFVSPIDAMKSFDVLLVTSSGGREASIDAVCKSVTDLKLSWRPHTKRVFMMFTDEIPQTYTQPSVSVSDCTTKAMDAAMEVHIWTLLNLYRDWAPIVAQPMNSLNPLESTKEVLRNRVLSIIGSGC